MPEPIQVHLDGCAPDLLMGYLKGIGVLRLVAEQDDPTARGAWRQGAFILTSRLDSDGLTAFLLDRYLPTPILAPWGARTGFYGASSESAAREALNAIAATRDARFAPFREAIEAIRSLLVRLRITAKPKEKEKLRLLRECRAWLPERILPWLDACFVLTEDSRVFPPLLGTGGNDGSADFTSNFMQHIRSVLIDLRDSAPLLREALFHQGRAPLAEDRSPGQYNPGGVGGPNATHGFEAGSLVNPWDYILMLEGTLLFAGAAVRRFGAEGRGGAAYPFTVRTTWAGYGSASIADESRDASRAELWLPLWSKPASLPEVTHLLAEGRAQVGRRQARTGVDFARAVAGLGVDRGVAAFQRYGLLRRSGRTFLATPLGQITVDGTRAGVAELLLEVDPWLDRVRAAASRDRVPAGCGAALRNLDRAIFGVCLHGDPRHLQEVVIALGEVEAALGTSLKFREENGLRPLHHLSPRWLRLCDDRSPAFRLAAALASIQGDREGRVPAIRCHLEPVATTGRQGLAWTSQDHAVAWTGRAPERDMAAVLERRVMEAHRAGLESLPLRGLVPASLAHVHEFLVGQVDVHRLTRLALGFATLQWAKYRREEHALLSLDIPTPADISRAYCLLKLLHLPGGIEFRDGRAHLSKGEGSQAISMRPDGILIRLLRAGRVPEACDRAAARLRASGLIPLGTRRGHRSMSWSVSEGFNSERIAAALLLPIVNVEGLARAVLRAAPLEEEEKS